MFSTLLSGGLITSNPAQAVKMRSERNRRARVIRPAEYEAFFAALAAAPVLVRLLVQFLLLTSVRLGNALSCRWSAIDWDRRTISVPDTKNGDRLDLPLCDEAIAVLRELHALRRNEFVFPGRYRGHMTRPSRHFKALIEAAGMPDLWVHDLRRTWSSVAAQTNAISVVSRHLGHRSIAVTQRYVVTHDTALHAAAASVGASLRGAMGLAAPSSARPATEDAPT